MAPKEKFKIFIEGPMSFTLAPGQTHQLQVTVKNKSGVDITNKCTFSWRTSNSVVATVNQTGLVTGGQASGTCNITVTATSQGVSATSGNVVVTNSGVVITPPSPPPPPPAPSPPGELEATFPRELINTARSVTPSLGSTIVVNNGDDLQAKYNSANAGDILEIQASSIFPMNLIIVPKSGMDAGHYITIKKSGTLPPEGTNIKVSPAIANSTLGFPLIRSTNVLESMYTNGAAAFVRFIGIAFDVDPVQTQPQGVIALGDASTAQNDLSQVPHHIILDACAVGSGGDNQDCRRGIRLNGAYLSVVDCAVTNLKSGFDSQAISGTNGPGPFKIYHNLLEAAGEAVAWGGGDPHIPNLVPSDIECRYNLFTKRMSWLGSQWTIKNHYESKNSMYSWLRGNIFENVWPSGQNGLFISLWSANQDQNAPWSITAHQTVEFNLLRNGVTVFAVGALPPLPGQIGQQAHHFTLKNNLALNLNVPPFNSNSAPGMLMGKVDQLVLRHNDWFSGYSIISVVEQGLQYTDLVIENNMWGGGGQFFSGLGQNNTLWNIINGPGSRNVNNIYAAMLTNQIPGNMYPIDNAAIGLTGGEFAMYGTQVSGMKLATSSPYKNQANDGTDPGVDTDTLTSELALTATAV